ncbi:MAG: GGDEF domain-containing protein [Clostridia bacterium]|nr:GGDEF domain-containing protein [Clostridia bacterium]
MDRYDKTTKGIQIRKLGLIIAIATAVISLLLFVGTYLSYVNYGKVINTFDDYIEWQSTADKMREISDDLTEQARDFARTGEDEHLEKYFTEARDTKTRDKVLEYIGEEFPDTNIYNSLKKAFDKSVELMNTEYLAMRLKIESMPDKDIADYTDYPEVRNAPLTVDGKYDYSGTTSDEKGTIAREILFDGDYMDAKDYIINHTRECITKLNNELKNRQSDAEDNMRFAFTFEVIMIALFIGYSVFILVITSRQVFDPIINSIPFIKNDAPMPVEGAHELRVLANTYNAMYNNHHKETSGLQFKTEHDALIGALNRRALDKLQSAADDGKVAFLIVDIDNFKQVNDTYGHAVGDKILVKVVSYLRLYLRSEDRIFRIGGDEFAVVMFGIDEKARHTIQSKFDKINQTLLEEKPHEGLPAITLSVGVAFGTVIDQTLITNADNALYDRKRSGKAGVNFHE